MDFISGFPKVEGFESALVMVDIFSKYFVFIPTHMNVQEVARIFFNNFMKHFGMPKDIVSDQDA